MSDPAVFFVVLVAFAVIMVGVLYKFRLLTLPELQVKPDGKLALMTPLIGFLLFMAACAFIPTLTRALLHYADTHGLSSFSEQESDNFSQLMTLVVSAILLMGFSRIHPLAIRERIWGQKSAFKQILKGILYCLICYPIVMALVQGIHLALDWAGQKPYQEQVALSQLKAIRSFPWLFWTFTLSIVTLVPLVEEFLFRGLLQNYCVGFLGPKLSIILSSIFFALFHYSSVQGSTNVELMIGLFFYSYLIGTFYLREQSLWTPIAMHATFNAFTIYIMFFVI